MQQQHLINRMLIGQAVMVLLCGFAGLFINKTVAISAFVGGSICFLPNLYLAFRIFRAKRTRGAANVLRSLYVGEAIKFIFTAALFVLAIKLIQPLSPVAFFLSFAVVQVANWLIPAISQKQQR